MLRRVLDREGLVKTNLAQTLVDCVKELQLKHAAERSGSLKNDESTNALCFCLEAIFIHGLKNPFLKSMSSVLHSASWENQTPEPSFWEFVLIFCHQEVILQISSLFNINTDIGRCRAWLRVILNDGLLISYMQLILTDKKVLKEYYKPSAFLRDLERCDIMKSYLFGIESYDFQLACNSSLLNSWNSTPLSLVGLWTPTDSVAQGIDVAENMDAKVLQALPNLKLQSISPNPLLSPYSTFGRAPLLEEEEALRVILSSKGSTPSSVTKSSASSSRKNSDGDTSEKSKAVTVSVLATSNAVIRKSSSTTKDKELTEVKSEVADVQKKVKVPFSEDVIRAGENESNRDIEIVSPSAMSAAPWSDTSSPGFSSSGNSEVAHGLQSRLTADRVPIPSPTETPEEEESYAALFQSYNRYTVIGTPITIGSFSESSCFLSFQKTQTENETTVSSDPALGSSLEDNHNTDIAREEFDFEVVPVHRTQSSSVDFLDLPTKLHNMIQNIPNESGLDVQNYKCRQCGRLIGMIYGAARVCGFSGNYYCSECHLNDEYVIPSRMLMNWDFNRFSVCKQAKDFLQDITDKPIFDLNQINSKLYVEIEECAELQRIRTQLQSISIYLKTCKEPVMQEFSKEIWPKEHLYEKIHHYSIADLLNIPNRMLYTSLNKLVVYGRSHIKSCDVCRQKGFVCEICRDTEVIFPFDLDSIFKCSSCGAVYHNKCMNNNTPCPRCERWRIKTYDEDTTL